MPDQVKLTVDIKNDAPVELNDLTDSLRAIADEFESFAISQGQDVNRPGEAKLYVKEIRKGSIIVDLVNYLSPNVVPLVAATVPVVGVAVASMSEMNTVLKFGEYLQKGYDSLFRRTKDRENLGKSTLKNLAQSLAHVAKDPDGRIEIRTGDIYNGNVYQTINYGSPEANKIRRQADLELNKKEQPESSVRKKQVLYFYQTRNTIGNKTGDRGKITTLYRKDVKILFSDDNLKKQIISGNDNIYHWGYVVDVEITYKEERPIAYKVIRLHEKYRLQPDEEDLV